MTYLFIEIGGFRQLVRIRPRVAESLSDGIRNSLSSNGFLLDSDGRFLLSLELTGDGQAKRIEGIFEVLSLLSESVKRIQHYVMLIIEDESADVDRLMSLCRRSLYGAPMTDSLLVAESAWDVARPLFSSATESDGYLVVDPDSYALLRPFLPFREYAKQESVIDRIIERVAGFVTDDDHPDAILVYGPRFSGKVANVSAALEQLKGKSAHIDWMILDPAHRDTSVITPFARSIKHTFFRQVGDYLSEAERRIWRSTCNILYYDLKAVGSESPEGGGGTGASADESIDESEARVSPTTDSPPTRNVGNIIADSAVKDFYFAFRLYLLAYARFLNERLLPPVVICSNVSSFSKGSLELLRWLLKESSPLEGVIPIFTSIHDNLPEELNSLECGSLAAEVTGEEDIQAFLPEESKLSAAELFTNCGGKSLPAYHALWLLNNGHEPSTGNPRYPMRYSIEAALSFDHLGKQFLYAVRLVEGLVGIDDVFQFFAFLGTDREHTGRVIEQCRLLGFLDDPSPSVLRIPGLRDALEKSLGNDAERLQTSVGRYLHSLWERGEIEASAHLHRLLSDLGLKMESAEVLDDYLTAMGDASRYSDVDGYLSVDDVGPIEPILVTCHRLRRATSMLAEQEASQFAAVLEKSMADSTNSYSIGRAELELARYHGATGDHVTATTYAKRASMSFYEQYPTFEARADVELGANLLCAGKLDDASDYFAMARSTIRFGEGPLAHLQADSLELVSSFVFGNISLALRIANRGMESAEFVKRREWQLFFSFAAGRALFEFGKYDEADTMFQHAMALSELYRKEVFHIPAAWSARCALYRGDLKGGAAALSAIRPNAECKLFIKEACILATSDNEPIVVPDESDVVIPPINFISNEAFTWSHGFADIEGHAFRNERQDGTLGSLHTAYTAHISTLSGRSDEAVEILRRLTRAEKPPANDPYNSIYFYFLAQALALETAPDSLDRITALSQALKHVQIRAARVDTVDRKMDYLHSNLWNARIIADAQEVNLL